MPRVFIHLIQYNRDDYSGCLTPLSAYHGRPRGVAHGTHGASADAGLLQSKAALGFWASLFSGRLQRHDDGIQ
ncbi:hypothetical protein KQX54_003740 [Cotesia glomerata]|uniref:Uncharacterized protein n=1 Tax=Cotesia glomerata TaxID=32391 RepID=A0AAV7I3K5_COTGL|nr:hypothetical protein KQX54_003740 [Cotesia glomerata]